jgi:hypothetical protein
MAHQINWRHHAVGRNAGCTYEEVKIHVSQSVQCSVSSVHYTELDGSEKLMGQSCVVRFWSSIDMNFRTIT